MFVPNLRDIHVACPRIVNGKRHLGSVFEIRIGRMDFSDGSRNSHSKYVPAKVNVKWLSLSLEKAKRNVSLLGVFVSRVINFFLCIVGRKGRIARINTF